MKFRLHSAEKLYKAYRQVLDTTPRYDKKNEVALELVDGELIMYRDSSTAYCEYRLEADLIGQEDGKVIIANGTCLEFVSGIHEVNVTGNIIRLNNLETAEYTELPVSSTEPFVYGTAEVGHLEFMNVPEDFQNTTWVARQNNNPLYEYLYICPTVIGTHEGSIVASFMTHELPIEVITDVQSALALPSNFDLTGVKEIAFDSGKVWFRGDSFLSSSNVNVYASGLPTLVAAYNSLKEKIITTLTGKRTELLALFSVMDKLSQVDTLKLALTNISLFGGELQLTSLETGGVRKLKVEHEGEIVSERIRPRQFASAIGALVDDEVTIRQMSDGGKGYLWVISDSKITNLIAALDRDVR